MNEATAIIQSYGLNWTSQQFEERFVGMDKAIERFFKNRAPAVHKDDAKEIAWALFEEWLDVPSEGMYVENATRFAKKNQYGKTIEITVFEQLVKFITIHTSEHIPDILYPHYASSIAHLATTFLKDEVWYGGERLDVSALLPSYRSKESKLRIAFDPQAEHSILEGETREALTDVLHWIAEGPALRKLENELVGTIEKEVTRHIQKKNLEITESGRRLG